MNDKQHVAEYVASLVTDGMLVGLGTGSTANFFIEALACRQREENLRIQTVSSSIVSAIKAHDLGLPILSIEQIEQPDIYVDGADEVGPDLTLLKGRGSDLVREKLLAKASKSFWVLIDPTKRVERLGANFPIPIEVMPFAWRMVKRSVEAIGGRGDLRPNTNKDGLAITSYGSLVLDMRFDKALDAKNLNDLLDNIPGVVEHGIFHGLATEVFCGCNGQIQQQSAKY